jgi:hypothetical protein
MDFGGDLTFAHNATIYVLKIFLSKRIQKGSQANTKVRSKKHTMAFIHLIFFQIRVQLVILFYFI